MGDFPPRAARGGKSPKKLLHTHLVLIKLFDMERSQPDLSVIIVTYNVRDLTLACLRSLYRDGSMTRFNIEVLVVDNASADNTVTAIETEFPHVCVIKNAKNLGFALGNNVGLAIAQGRYLFLLNSDTEVNDGALGALIEFMDANAEAGAGCPMLLNPDGSLQPTGRPLPSLWSVFVGMTKLYRLWKKDFYLQPGRDYNKVTCVGEVSGAAMLVRKSVYDQTGGFDPKLFIYYEDVDWCKRIHDLGFKVFYIPQARVMHIWQRITKVLPERTYRASQDSLRYYFYKHHGPVAHSLIQALLFAKEMLLLVVSALKQDKTLRQLHRHMLSNVFSPLPK